LPGRRVCTSDCNRPADLLQVATAAPADNGQVLLSVGLHRQRSSSIRACPGAGRSAFLADPQSADAEPVVLGQFGCPVAGTDFVTRVGVGDPEAKPAHAIARTEGDVVVSDHLACRDDGRYTVWIVEAQRGHASQHGTGVERCRLPCLATRRGAYRLRRRVPAVRHRCRVTATASRRADDEPQSTQRRRRRHSGPDGIAGDRDPRWSARDPTRCRRETWL
jgi:hypothetical protein